MKGQYLLIGLFGLLTVIGYFLTWGEWRGPLPPGMGPPDGWRRATLNASYAIDLETGAVTDSAESARDMWWQARTETEFCLCPYRLHDADTLMAPVPAAELDALGADRAAALSFSERGYELRLQERELATGLGFALRTGAGNFAKVRVLKVRTNKSLTLEWQMLGAAAATGAVAGNPSLEAHRLLGEVRARLRGGPDRDQAAALLDQLLPLADQYSAAGTERIDLLNEIGRLYWSARRPDTALAVISRSAREIAARDGLPGASPPGWETAQQTYWWLGILNRDAGRYADAVPWVEQSLAAARAGTTRDHNEEGSRRMAITSALNALYQLECRKGNAPAAADRLRELQQTCAEMLPHSRSHGACAQQQPC